MPKLMHGLEGEVIQMDTLRMKFIRGWRINPWLYTLDMAPTMVPIVESKDSYVFGGNPLNFMTWRERAEMLLAEAAAKRLLDPKPDHATVEKKGVSPVPKTGFSTQLSLF